MYNITINIPRELKLASNNCYDNVSMPCGQIFTVYWISTKILVILTKDNIKFSIYTQAFICNIHHGFFYQTNNPSTF